VGYCFSWLANFLEGVSELNGAQILLKRRHTLKKSMEEVQCYPGPAFVNLPKAGP
jgi:hypothetical protein